MVKLESFESLWLLNVKHSSDLPRLRDLWMNKPYIGL